MDNIWVILTVLLVFSIVLLVCNRHFYKKGYRKGASKILEEWKEFNRNFEEEYEDEE